MQGCTVLPAEPWEDEYFQKTSMDGHHNLDCTNDVAKEIAVKAVKDEYPEHFKAFLKKGFSLYSPIYGDYKGKQRWRYTYKSILGYKKIEHLRNGGSYYEKSIEVSLSKSCQILGVDYFKGKIEYLY